MLHDSLRHHTERVWFSFHAKVVSQGQIQCIVPVSCKNIVSPIDRPFLTCRPRSAISPGGDPERCQRRQKCVSWQPRSARPATGARSRAKPAACHGTVGVWRRSGNTRHGGGAARTDGPRWPWQAEAGPWAGAWLSHPRMPRCPGPAGGLPSAHGTYRCMYRTVLQCIVLYRNSMYQSTYRLYFNVSYTIQLGPRPFRYTFYGMFRILIHAIHTHNTPQYTVAKPATARIARTWKDLTIQSIQVDTNSTIHYHAGPVVSLHVSVHVLVCIVMYRHVL